MHTALQAKNSGASLQDTVGAAHVTGLVANQCVRPKNEQGPEVAGWTADREGLL